MGVELATAEELYQLRADIFRKLESIESKVDRALNPDAYVPASVAMRFSGHTSPQGFTKWAERKGIEYQYLSADPGSLDKPKRVWNRLQVIQRSKLPDYRLQQILNQTL